MRVTGRSAPRTARLLCVGMTGLLMLRTHTMPADEGKSEMKSETAFRVPPGERQLCLDDCGIAKIETLARTMHQPDKKGAVIRVDYQAHPGYTIQTRTAPVWDPEKRIYKFWCISLGDNEGCFESPDGLSWGPGPKMNMQVRMVVRDGKDPDPARRYKAALLNNGFAVSPDGIDWKKLDVPEVPSSDEGNFSYSEKDGMFIHTVKRSGPFGRAVAIATSRDFKTWKDYGVVFHADAKDQELGRARIKARLADPTLKQTEYDTPEH